MPAITVTILTKNSAATLAACLSSLGDFDEIIVLDNGSTDETISIAEGQTNVRVYRSEFIGFGPLKDLAASHAANDWIFNIDSDEVASPELVASILNHQLAQDAVGSVHRHNHYRGRLINGCGWQRDFIRRLYNRQATSFGETAVHEALQPTPGGVSLLNGPLFHYPYESAADLIEKMQHYSTLYAKERCGKESSSAAKAVLRGSVRFVRDFILKRGFMYGRDGWTISYTNAAGVFYKHIKLCEENEKLAGGDG